MTSFKVKRNFFPSRWLVVAFFAVFLSGVLAVQAQGAVTGIVFRDFNGNGAQDATEPGIGGIVITAFTPTGASSTTTTSTAFATLGEYSIPIPTAEARLEFTVPTYLEDGAYNPALDGSRTTVQFVTAGGIANLALQDPSQYCDGAGSARLATTCYLFGDQILGASAPLSTVRDFAYNSGTTADPATSGAASLGGAFTNDAVAADVGAVWGLAYHRAANVLFAGAFTKRHVGYGPTDNPGTIYLINRATGGVLPFVTLPAGANPHTPTNTTPNEPPYFDDSGAFGAVGRTGLADIELSSDEETLYAVNMANNSLYIIGLGATLGSAPVSQTSVPIPAAAGCPGVSRPGALKYYDGILYVGVTCTGPTAASLSAQVFAFNGASFAGPVATAPLTYGRGFISIDGTTANCPAQCASANWLPWSDNPADLLTFTNYDQFYRPQPWLLDLEVDEFGFLIMSLGDRAGHQLGNNQGLAQRVGPVEGVSGGDTLRLAPNPGFTSWTLESNGSSGVGIPGGSTSGGVGNGQGPGGGEFYYEDRYELGSVAHNEVHQGGLALLYGSGEVVSAAMDPAAAGDVRAGGVTMSSNTTGERTRSIEIFSRDETFTFGKAAGIGDIEILCAPAPIEVGNRVWLDVDLDGVQDAGEAPLPGVTVELYSPTGVLLATAITDANGDYYFSSGGGSTTGSAIYNIAGLTYNTDGFEVRIPTGQAALTGLTLTTPNSDASVNGDSRDSDGLPIGVNAVAAFNTGGAGENNHTYDFGFNGTPTGTLSLGNRVWFDVNNDGLISTGELGVDGVTLELYLDANADGVPDGAAIGTTTTIGGGYYLFDNLAPGTYIVGVPAGNFGGVLSGYQSSTGAGQSATPNNNIDSDDNGIDSPTPATTGILSGPVTLTPAGEPIGETDIGPQGSGVATNPNSNLTVDFGFFQPPTNTLSLGNRVWIDTDNDGTQNGGEVGVGNVRLSLYRDDNGDNVPDGPAIATTTTNGSGYYLFTGLTEGRYIVGVDASNFVAGGPLVGSLSSSGPGQEANPDGDGDLVDNGIDNPTPSNGGIFSNAVTLSLAGEPTVEPDGASGSGGAPDDNSNLTVDFGFTTPTGGQGGGGGGTPPPGGTPVPGVPSGGSPVAGGTTSSPGISKSVDTPFASPGSRVTWTVTASNPTSAPLNNVTVTDTVPGALSIISVSGGGSISGQTVTWRIGMLAPGASQSFTIVTEVRPGTAGTAVTNVVILDGDLLGEATATLVIVGGLPQTGETPWWRWLALLGIAGVAGYAAYRLRRVVD